MNRVKQKAHQRELVHVSNVPNEDKISPINEGWDYFLRFLREQREIMDKLVKYVQQLENENNNLKRQLESLKTPEITANEDYQALLKIMSRARGLGALKLSESHV